MRYAIVSDIHANIQAWEAVLKDIQKQGVDAILCLGDVIGYGPNPVEVLESCHQHIDYFVLGNHDAVVGDRMESSLFNDSAKYLIKWTRNQLSDSAAKFFAEMPLRMEGETFACAHAELALPGRFSYLYEPNDCISSFDATRQNILFVGHTHMQTKFTWSEGRLLQGKNDDFKLIDGDRYLVNAGSVGDPRDGKTNAHYIIYDEADKFLQYKSIPFDIQSFKINLAKAKLPVTPFFVMIDEGQSKEAETIKDMDVMSDNQVSSSDTEITIFDKEEMLETRTRRLTRSINFSPETMKKIQTHRQKVEESRTKGFEENRKKSYALLATIIILLIIASAAAFFLLKSDEKKETKNKVEIKNVSLENELTDQDVNSSENINILSAYDGDLKEEDNEVKIWSGPWLNLGEGTFSFTEKGLLPKKYSSRKSVQISQNCLTVSGKSTIKRALNIDDSGIFNKMDVLKKNKLLVQNKKTVYLSFILKVENNSDFEIGFGKNNKKARNSYWSIGRFNNGKEISLRNTDRLFKISEMDNSPHLIIVKISEKVDANSVFIYIDPELSKEPPLPALKVDNPGSLSFNTLIINTEQGSKLFMDEFRAGTSFEAVIPK